MIFKFFLQYGPAFGVIVLDCLAKSKRLNKFVSYNLFVYNTMFKRLCFLDISSITGSIVNGLITFLGLLLIVRMPLLKRFSFSLNSSDILFL
jgi:hypothetical protein